MGGCSAAFSGPEAWVDGVDAGLSVESSAPSRLLEGGDEDESLEDARAAEAAVIQNGRALLYAHEELTKDLEVVQVAGSHNGGALLYAHVRLRHDPEAVKVVVSQNITVWSVANEDLTKDREVEAVSMSYFGFG
jgi:hypothetical protein